jgi:spermidine synthase
VIPWELLDRTEAPDGELLELRRRGHEHVIRAGGHELMSSEDEGSSRSLAELGCAHLREAPKPLVLVGGLGMGFTLRAALDAIGARGVVEVAELVPAVVEWNRNGPLGALANHPLRDPRTKVQVGDVRDCMRAGRERYDAILLDVDNGPIALAHAANDALYGRAGLATAWNALAPGGVLGVWSLLEDRRFTAKLERQGFDVQAHHVPGSRRGRGRHHVVWTARRPPRGGARNRRRD